MALDFPSTEWVAAYKDAINANAEYKKAGKDWTHGVVAMVVKADIECSNGVIHVVDTVLMPN